MAKTTSKRQEREKLRDAIAAALAGLSVLFVVATTSSEIYSYFINTSNESFINTSKESSGFVRYLKETVLTIVPALIALFSSIVGYYFGSKKP